MALQEILINCRDTDKYPEVFRDTDGSDITLEGYLTRAEWLEKNRPRRIILMLTSYRGISWNAIHYYGTLTVEGISFSPKNDPTCYTSGPKTYTLEKENPLAKCLYRIEIVRPLTKKEIEEDPSRWEWMDEGSLTNGFESVNEIQSVVEEIIKERFVGNWKLEIDDRT